MVAIYINKHRKKEQTMNNEQPESTTKGYKDCERKDTRSLYASIKRQEKAATNEVKEKQPYFANAQVGDEVVCIIYGKGVVKRINKSYIFTAITVEYPTSNSTSSPTKPHTQTYSLEGKYSASANQTLFYVEDVIILIASTGVEPKREYIPQIGDIIEVNDKIGIVVSYKDFNKRFIALTNDLRVGNFHKQKVTFVKHYNTIKEAVNSEEFNLNF